MLFSFAATLNIFLEVTQITSLQINLESFGFQRLGLHCMSCMELLYVT